MARARDIRKVRNDVKRLRRQLKIAQKHLFRSWDLARTTTFDINTFAIIEQKEKHFRSMKHRLAGMEDIPEPVKVKPWKVPRPSTESRLINFCEA